MSQPVELPKNTDAERALASILLCEPRTVGAQFAEWGIDAEAFMEPIAQTVVRYALAAWSDNKPGDAPAIGAAMRAAGEAVVTLPDVLDLADECQVPSAFPYYAGMVVEAHRLRGIYQTCAIRGAEALSPGADAEAIISKLAEETATISGAAHRGTTKPLRALLMDKLTRMESGEAEGNRLKTGIAKLDAMSPLCRGDMPLISGERKSGKSIFALNIAANMVLAGMTVGYFSLEDRTPKVIDRLFALQSRLPMIAHDAKRMTEGEMQRATAAITTLADKRLLIRDDVFDLLPILAVIRQWKAQHPDIAAVVVDYAQLVRVRLGKTANREQEVAAISRAFRLISMETDIALLLLCQLNKDGDTRESKALEQDCTAMWKILLDGEESHGKRIIGIPFQRNGDMPLAFPVTFLGHIAKIENFAEDEKPVRNYHDK